MYIRFGQLYIDLSSKTTAASINSNRIIPKAKETIIMARQLRTFRDGENVQLSLHSSGGRDPWVVEATIISRDGTGAEERIHLHDAADPRKAVWDIYRFKGHWAWGSTGNRVTVYEENPKPRKPRTRRTPSAAPTPSAPATTNNASKAVANNPAPKRRGRPRKTVNA